MHLACAGWLALVSTPEAAGQETRIGVLGDSLSDEYFETPSFSAAKNWLELLVEHRGIDAGTLGSKEPSGSWGEPRRTGYRFNWARVGSTSRTLVRGGQHTGLAADAAALGVSHAIIAIGSNDFHPLVTTYAQIYRAQWSAAEIDAFEDRVVHKISVALHEAQRAGMHVVLVSPVDFSRTPSMQDRKSFSNVQKQKRVGAVLRRVCSRLAHLARENGAAFVDWRALQRAVVGPRESPRATLLVGNVPIDLQGNLGAPDAAFLQGGSHPGTVVQGVLANVVVTALNRSFATAIPLFSERELLENAGLEYGGADTLAAQIGSYEAFTQ